MSKTTDLVTALQCCVSCAVDACRGCQFYLTPGCIAELKGTAAEKIEEMTDRCARYAEEIAVLRERQRWIPVTERLPEYGVSVLAVASGKAANITLRDTVVFATFWDGWELDDYPQAEDVAVKWWRPMVESPEREGGEHEV